MLSLQNISKSYGDKLVLDDINLSLQDGEVVALIGENGSGKTTLLKIIRGDLAPDSGRVVGKAAIGYVPQVPARESVTVLKSLGDIAPWQADYALERVGLTGEYKNKVIRDLSGGQKTKVALAQVLAQSPEPTALLLDEPTNNLDADGLAWLERFVNSFRGLVLIASHDRTFINKVAGKILEIKGGRIREFEGNYDDYKQQLALERLTEERKYEKSQAEKRKLKNLRTAKMSHMQKSEGGKYVKEKHEDKMSFKTAKAAAQSNFGKQLRAIDSRMAQIEDVSKPDDVKTYRARLGGEVPIHKLIIRAEGLTKSYDRLIFEGVSLEVRGRERWLVEGANGSGKTTLLKILAGVIPADSGEVKLGESVRIGYFSQDIHGLDATRSAIDNLEDSSQATQDLYQQARSMGLKEAELEKTPDQLSRGQQAKLAFVKLLASDLQLLILDEPTNHLDIVTREVIEDALSRYSGALIVASHDRYFVEKLDIKRTLKLG